VATELLLWLPEKIATAILLRNGRHAKEFCRAPENGEDRFVLRGPKLPKRRRRARMIACRCSEAEPRASMRRAFGA